MQVAAGRDNAVNRPALSFVVRPALEVAGQLAWLLDDSIDGEERGRRFLVWRFADLRQQRLLINEFRLANAERASAVVELAKVEKALLGNVSAAKWTASPTVVGPKGFEAAALLDAAGRRVSMPKYNELVRLVSSTPSLYSLLCVPVHGVRFGMFYGLAVEEGPVDPDQDNAQVAGFGLDPNICIGLAALSIDRSCRLLAGWNHVDAGSIHQAVKGLMRMAGIVS